MVPDNNVFEMSGVGDIQGKITVTTLTQVHWKGRQVRHNGDFKISVVQRPAVGQLTLPEIT